jgi:hypothetical protein
VVTINLTSDELSRLLKPVRGEGGWQRLLRKLQAQLRGPELSLTPQDVARICRYREKYGDGGWQGRLSFLKRHSLDVAA